jgi:hypothetical protein
MCVCDISSLRVKYRYNSLRHRLTRTDLLFTVAMLSSRVTRPRANTRYRSCDGSRSARGGRNWSYINLQFPCDSRSALTKLEEGVTEGTGSAEP